MAGKTPGRAEGENGKEPERKLSAIDRAVLAAIGDGRIVGLPDDPARERFPQLWEWLTLTEAGRDYVMQPAVVTVQLGPEGVLVTMTHRDLRRTVSVACKHLEEAYQALQTALDSPNPPMRSWGKDDPHLRKRRPKG